MAVVVLISQTWMILWLAAVLEEKTSSGGIRSREEGKKRKVTNDGGGIIKETASISNISFSRWCGPILSA